MNKKEWYWMNQGKSPKQMRDSYIGAGIGFLCGSLIIIGLVIWNLIKNW